MGMKVTVIAPHADDAELGVGGTMAKMAKQGADITVVLLSASSSQKTTGGVNGGDRLREQQEALQALHPGITLDPELVAVDGSFDQVRHKIVQALDRKLRLEDGPRYVFCPLPSYHQDHQVTYDACVSALRPGFGHPGPQTVLLYEYPGQDFSHHHYDAGMVFSRFGDEEMDRKIAALYRHKSQAVSQKSGLFGLDAVRTLAKWRGHQAEAPYAEMFRLFRSMM